MRGEGARLWDADGNEYLDFLCGISVTSLGHCHPRVVEAVREQAGRLMHASNLFYTEPAMRLAQRLSRVEPRRQGVLLQLRRGGQRGGDQARAQGAPGRRHRGRARRLSRAHLRRAVGHAAGVQAGAVRAAGARAFARSSPTPAALAAAVDERTAAVLLEPIQGESGVHVLSDELLAGRARGLRRARRGADLRRDPVRDGAHGTLWAYEQTGVVPDAITTAKALGGGLPIGALVTGERLADVLAAGDHGSTFAGGPVVAAAALAALELTDDRRAARRRARARRQLAEGARAAAARARRARARADARVRARRRRAGGRCAGRCSSSGW